MLRRPVLSEVHRASTGRATLSLATPSGCRVSVHSSVITSTISATHLWDQVRIDGRESQGAGSERTSLRPLDGRKVADASWQITPTPSGTRPRPGMPRWSITRSRVLFLLQQYPCHRNGTQVMLALASLGIDSGCMRARIGRHMKPLGLLPNPRCGYGKIDRRRYAAW